MGRFRGEALHIVLLIVRREFLTRARSRLFIGGTALLMGLMVGYIVVQDLFISKAVTTVSVGFAGGAEVLAAPLKAVANSATFKVETSTLTSVADGLSQVRAGKLDAMVSGDAGAPDVAVMNDLDPTVAATLDALVKQVALSRALTASGVGPGPIEAQVGSAGIHVQVLDPNAKVRTERQVVAIVVAVLLYVALVLYGQIVAAGVVEEKANRIIEILLSTVRARQLLFGKVVGIGLLGMTQLVLVAAVALVAVVKTQVISVPSVEVVSVLGGLLWFALGFVFFALIFAAGGSMVSRQEDLGSVTAPISMLLVGTYIAYFWVVSNPTNPLAVGLSLLPPFAPILMPARMASGDAQAWQVLAAVALMVAAIIGMNWLAARIYVNSVLRVGARVGWRQALRGVD
ncbi:MAG TPA: ABC transporter permease [Candidatus Acidoferrum sp.]|jgi:ABC-2 type transport system permease protein|nr:ABC transporter permease [Candidatus Acidoferrum sp.]